MGHVKVSNRINEKHILAFTLIIAFFVRLYPYLFLASGWVVEDGPIIYWTINFLRGYRTYIRLYPHTAIIGMSLLHILGIPINWAAKIWGPLMGTISTYLVYRLIKLFKYPNVAIYGSILFSVLESNIYRTCSLSPSLEATGMVFSLSFLYYYFKGNKLSYALLFPLIYTHYIVFAVTCIFVFAWWFYNSSDFLVTKLLLLCTMGVFFFVVLGILPIGYAMYQMVRTIQGFSLEKIMIIYGIREVKIVLSTLFVTFSLYFYNLFFGENKTFRVIAIFYGVGVIASIVFYSPIVSPYRLVIHMGILGVFGLMPTLVHMDNKQKTILVSMLCIISFYQTSSTGYIVHVNFDDALSKDELDMITFVKNRNKIVDYSRVFWDDVGLENCITMLPIVYTNVDPYSTRDKDYGLWNDRVDLKLSIINGKNDSTPTTQPPATVPTNTTIIDTPDKENNPQNNTQTQPTPIIETPIVEKRDPQILPIRYVYVFYSKRFSERAVYRLPDENGRLIYKNYKIEDIWKDNNNWALVYNISGNKIYERVPN